MVLICDENIADIALLFQDRCSEILLTQDPAIIDKYTFARNLHRRAYNRRTRYRTFWHDVWHPYYEIFNVPVNEHYVNIYSQIFKNMQANAMILWNENVNDEFKDKRRAFLFPTKGDNIKIPVEQLKNMVLILKKLGYDVYLHSLQGVHPHYDNEYQEIPGTTLINLNIKDVLTLIGNKNNLFLFNRTGLSEVVFYLNPACKVIVYYMTPCFFERYSFDLPILKALQDGETLKPFIEIGQEIDYQKLEEDLLRN